MKCKKCNAEWQVDASRSASITVCPFCQEKIEAEKASDWKYFDNTKELLAYVATEYGNDALFGRKYFTDHSSPMMPQGQKNLVKQAFDCGAVKVLQDNVNSDQAHKEIAAKQAVRKLEDTYASAKEAAERVVWELTNAIGWGLSEPQGGTVPPDNGGRVAPLSPQPTKNPPAQPSAPGVSALMTRAWQFAEDGDWKEAADYFNKVLDVDPVYAPAFLGLLCVDLEISKEDNLSTVKDPGSITNHKYYKRAIADPTIKTKLDGYVQIIKDRIDAEKKMAEEASRRKCAQDAFDNSCKILNNAQSPDDYRKAITAFGNIDSNYQDINGQIKGKIAECERNIQQMAAELDKVLAPLREKFSPKLKAEKLAKLQEQRKVDEEHIDKENAKTKADVEEKCLQIQQKFDADHKAWQDEYNRLKAPYDTEYKKWETEANAIKAQAEQWKSQGLCPHDGGTLKGLLGMFVKKCTKCGKAPSGPVKTPPAPTQPNYPTEPSMPQMPTYTPRVLDESKYVLKEDASSAINQHITLAGIEWRILDVQDGKLLLISERILENRPYNLDKKDVTWESCTLRKYLNGEFYNRLGEAKLEVAETRNNNPNNQWYGTAGGNATNDKVFLLSIDELVKNFGDSGDLRNKNRYVYENSKYVQQYDGYYLHDQYNSARIANNNNNVASWWLLRSPGDFGIARVSSDGQIDMRGAGVKTEHGIRPALWLKL